MTRPDPFAEDALSRAVPRYTSYPTAPHFSDAIGPDTYRRWLGELSAATRLSLYVHIPFCKRLCFFCACRTQGVSSDAPVVGYLDRLAYEIEAVAAATPAGGDVAQVHWGGGSPSILAPAEIARLAAMIRAGFPGAARAGLEVELDPRDTTPARLDALAEAGLSRASIGVQDFAAPVQAAIGRMQGEAATRETVEGLRARGVGGVNVDLVYGLPLQTEDSLVATLDAVIAMAPDRVSLFGYAHVPWMARRQRVIDAATLPDVAARRVLQALARERLAAAGYLPVGIDHFARPEDSMAVAAREGGLARNFQGYTVDRAEALIGLGASAIGRLPQGYVQNLAGTTDWTDAVEAGRFATARGRALGLDDRVRASVIEDLLCRFALDADALRAAWGDMATPVLRIAADLRRDAPEGALIASGRAPGFVIAEPWRERTRLIAASFDAYLGAAPARHSLAV